MILDKQAGNRYSMTNYVPQHSDAIELLHSQKMRMFPVSNQSNQTITISRGSPILQSHIASSGQNVPAKPLGGVSVVSPVSAIPITNSIIGTTDLR